MQVCASVHVCERATPHWEEGYHEEIIKGQEQAEHCNFLCVFIAAIVGNSTDTSILVTKPIGDQLVKKIHDVVSSLGCKNGNIEPVWLTDH